MKTPSYSLIKDSLVGLNRREQYQKLLNTLEWWLYRDKILARDKRKCTTCQQPEGPIYKEMPYEEWLSIVEPIRKANEEFTRFAKKYPEKIVQQILDGTFIGLRAEISREQEIGFVVLHAHHDLYFDNMLPWKYDLKYLRTLCSTCHSNFHANEIVYLYKDETRKYRKITKNCSRCGGTGFLPQYDYWFEGICFDCNGLGFDPEDSHEWELNPET